MQLRLAAPFLLHFLWAAYNGVTEYVDFHKYKTGDGKWLETIWFGAGDAIKTRAFDAALRASNKTAAAALNQGKKTTSQ